MSKIYLVTYTGICRDVSTQPPHHPGSGYSILQLTHLPVFADEVVTATNTLPCPRHTEPLLHSKGRMRYLSQHPGLSLLHNVAGPSGSDKHSPTALHASTNHTKPVMVA
jgi:hypothetical protein